MQNAEAKPAHAGTSQDPHHPSARRNGDDTPGSPRPIPYYDDFDYDDFADARWYSAPGVFMIVPVATALVITCAISPAITFVVLRDKGYSLVAASLGVVTGPMGLLLAIAAPSRLPAS
jgi:hypothetical protein